MATTTNILLIITNANSWSLDDRSNREVEMAEFTNPNIDLYQSFYFDGSSFEFLSLQVALSGSKSHTDFNKSRKTSLSPALTQQLPNSRNTSSENASLFEEKNVWMFAMIWSFHLLSLSVEILSWDGNDDCFVDLEQANERLMASNAMLADGIYEIKI